MKKVLIVILSTVGIVAALTLSAFCIHENEVLKEQITVCNKKIADIQRQFETLQNFTNSTPQEIKTDTSEVSTVKSQTITLGEKLQELQQQLIISVSQIKKIEQQMQLLSATTNDQQNVEKRLHAVIKATADEQVKRRTLEKRLTETRLKTYEVYKALLVLQNSVNRYHVKKTKVKPVPTHETKKESFWTKVKKFFAGK